MSTKVTPPQYTVSVITALKKYLSPFRIDDKPVPLHVKGYTREHDTPSFPYFFVEKFGLARDKDQLHSGLKTEYVTKTDGVYSKERAIPYRVSFSLEYVDTNPVNFMSVTEMLYAKLEREPYFNVDFSKSHSETCQVYLDNVFSNEYSSAYHKVFMLSVLVMFDPTIELKDVDAIDEIVFNGNVIKE